MSLEAITEINLDVNQPNLEVVHAKQYDTARKVRAHLFYNGVKWEVPTGGVTAVVSYKKADKIGGFYDQVEGATGNEAAVEIDSNDRSTVTISLDRATMTTVSTSQYPELIEITFYGGTSSLISERLSTFSFKLLVEASSITELDLVSSAQFNVLDQKMNQVINAANNLSGLTASASPLAPGADPTATVTGGTGASDPYNIELGIATFPGVTVTSSIEKLKPGGSPVVEITGGTSSSTAYNLKFKVPVFPGVNSPATVNTLTPGSDATVTISGGTTGTDKYSFTFGIPQGEKGDKPVPTSTQYRYATTTDYTAPPAASASSWSSTPDPQPGKYMWCETTTTWDNGQTTVDYNVSHIGANGTGSTAAEVTTNSSLTVQEELDYKILVIEISSLSSLPRTVSDSVITADHVVTDMVLGDPYVQIGDWTVTTSTGQAVITGAISGSTSLTMILAKATAL